MYVCEQQILCLNFCPSHALLFLFVMSSWHHSLSHNLIISHYVHYMFTKISTYLGHLFYGFHVNTFLGQWITKHFNWLTNCKRLARTKYFNQICIKKPLSDIWWRGLFLFHFSCSCRLLKWTMWFSKLQWGHRNRIDSVQYSVYLVIDLCRRLRDIHSLQKCSWRI